MRTQTIVGVVSVAALVVTTGLLILRADLHGFSTRSTPSAPERLAARTVRGWAVPRAMRAAVNPIPFSTTVWSEGRAHFADHCATCHGNDGSGDTEIGRQLYPKAPDMRLVATQQLSDGELYWIIENGVRLTGMPAWGDGTDHDVDTWKLVHFLRHLNELTPEHLFEMSSLNPRSPVELREEQEDRDFLNGIETLAGQPRHQH